MAPHTSCAILIVDDEPSIALALAKLLSRQGYTVTTAANGALAWEHLRTKPYEVILCDLVMPEIDGHTLYTLLQRDNPCLAARVIFLTGDTIGEASTAFLHQCGQPWVYKPCRADQVLRAIEQVRCTAEASAGRTACLAVP